MEKFYRMVMELYKQSITDIQNGKRLDQNTILEVKRSVECAITEAKIKAEPYDGLTRLSNDIDFLSCL